MVSVSVCVFSITGEASRSSVFLVVSGCRWICCCCSCSCSLGVDGGSRALEETEEEVEG